jgi:hypothetical protein
VADATPATERRRRRRRRADAHAERRRRRERPEEREAAAAAPGGCQIVPTGTVYVCLEAAAARLIDKATLDAGPVASVPRRASASRSATARRACAYGKPIASRTDRPVGYEIRPGPPPRRLPTPAAHCS